MHSHPKASHVTVRCLLHLAGTHDVSIGMGAMHWLQQR